MQEVIWDGSKICAPGIYGGIALEQYHGDICTGPSVSSSVTRTMQFEAAAEVWRTSPLNPKAEEREEKESYLIGSATHALVLGDEPFGKSYAITPETYVGSKGIAKWNGSANFCKDWKTMMEESGRKVLTQTQAEKIIGCAGKLPWQKDCPDSGLLNSVDVTELGLLDGLAERSIIWRDEKTGLWLKSRPDLLLTTALSSQSGTASDLKTTADIKKDVRSFWEFGYWSQAAFVREGVRQVTGGDLEQFVFVFVETKKPHSVAIITIGPDVMDRGLEVMRGGIDNFARCLEVGKWPASASGPKALNAEPYNSEDNPLGMPGWIERKLLAPPQYHMIESREAA